MDPVDLHSGEEEEGNGAESPRRKARELPLDLPRSLDDRKTVPAFNSETEIYDAWNGMTDRNWLCASSWVPNAQRR